MKNIILTIRDNVIEFNEEGHTYAEAFAPLNDLINLFKDLKNANLTNDESNYFERLGESLDKANTSLLLDGVIDKIAIELLIIAKGELDFEDSALEEDIGEVFDLIIDNIRTAEELSYAIEFKNLQNFINLISNSVEGEIDYETLKEELDNLVLSSVIITKDVIDLLLDILVDQAIESIKEEAGDIFTGEFEWVVDELKDALKDYPTFSDKLQALENFSDEIENLITAGDEQAVRDFINNLLNQ